MLPPLQTHYTALVKYDDHLAGELLWDYAKCPYGLSYLPLPFRLFWRMSSDFLLINASPTLPTLLAQFESSSVTLFVECGH